jgi:long-chain fatty acid transport protein
VGHRRVHLGVGASYKYSDRVTVDVGYSHLFFQDGPFCIANAALNGGSSHCTAATPAAAVLLSGKPTYQQIS